VSDIDIAVVDSLKVLDPKRPKEIGIKYKKPLRNDRLKRISRAGQIGMNQE